MYQFVDDLNEHQRAAVTASPNGVVLVLAGPGTGKTKVITARVAYLLLHHKLPPQDVVVATFTKKAANEMVERLAVLLQPYPEIDAKKLLIGTFHSICVRILRKYGGLVGLNAGFKIADETDAKQLIKRALRAMAQSGFDVSLKDSDVKKYRAYISACKNKAQLPDQVPVSKKAGDLSTKLEVYTLYQEELARNNVIDFDDCLLLVHKLLAHHPSCMGRVKHVLVDEFQDTNKVQLELVYQLSGYNENYKHNVTAVGDPDQSIYAFRNAEAENFYRMEDYYRDKGVAVLKVALTQNYRSTSNILTLAEHLMNQQFARREQKYLHAHKKDDIPVQVFACATNKAEASKIAATIKQAVKPNGTQYSDIAILLRSGFLSRVIEQELIHANLPYQVVHGRSFWERREIRLVMDYLRAVASDMDWLGYSRCLDFQVSGLGAKSLLLIEEQFSAQRARSQPGNVYVILENIARDGMKGITAKARAGIGEFVALIKKARELLLSDADEQEQLEKMFDHIVQHSRVVSVVNEERMDKKGDSQEEIEATLNELKNQLIGFNLQEEDLLQDAYAEEDELEVAEQSFDLTASTSLEKLTQFLDSVYLYEETKGAEKTVSKVTITTVHGSKGLEWPIVFVPSLCEGIFPSQHATSDVGDTAKNEAALDEERRCMYVAVTRAKERLYLSYFRETLGFGFGDPIKRKSRFLNLPKGLVQVAETGVASTPNLLSSFQQNMKLNMGPLALGSGFQTASRLTGVSRLPDGAVKISKPRKKRLGMGRPLRLTKK
ncbi:hypothetical protein KL942_002611 [Ogataea angusta]|uniref:DNA 3'-5' helicase n=1 Tax=Pichia angusta TaxID=870730 RepID=A0AAN6DGF4_PICAN|nr:uncharacterized protein KL928_002405 [Ogataea angusta]KAG7819731.1 hypothetical protein KL928_002405 [Ogataea angusta]KAG7840660.1 hypothetical protein KL942_002611 [Ogataea angusta]KAG7850568.1 hypothetical protein KL940_002128 [Ogataea angusta]